jgi:hypothetical protein
MSKEIYLIWSHEHGRWWMPGERGYTTSPALAGRYNRENAIRICIHAMPGTAERLGALPELPVLLADAEEIIVTFSNEHEKDARG